MDQHRLTDVDYEARKAMCSVCGPTTIYWSDKKGGGKTRFCAGKTGVKNPGSRPRQRDDGTWHRLTAREGTGWDCAVCGEDVPVAARGDRQVCRLRLSVHSSRYGRKASFVPLAPDWPAMLTAWREQGGTCLSCLQEKRLVPDHDHRTGKFRAWLCNECNLALGLLADDPSRLQRLLELL